MPRRLLKNLLSILVGMSWLAQGLGMATPVRAQAKSAGSALAYPCSGVIYDFADGAQGWKAQQYSQHRGKILSGDSDLPESPLGTNGLSLELNLDPNESAEFWVDLREEPPDCAAGLTQEVSWWAPGSVLSVWVWAPKGTRGEHPGIANGLHLFAIDRNDQPLYGTWQHFQEETWFEVTLNLDGGRPACGTMGYRFDFQHIKKLGLNIFADSKINYPIKDTIRISPIQVKSGEPIPPESSHRYLFDEPPAEGEPAAWRPLNDNWEAEAITANGVQDGALFLDTHFTLDNKEIGRKAVMGMVFAPALNLSNLKPEQDVFSLDVKFETASDFRLEKCPFALKLWASNKSLTFGSDDHHVGYDRWVHVSFRLKDFIILDEEEREAQGERELDLSRIDQIGFQIYGKIPYQGRIWVDNIAIGGIPQKQDPIQLSFVKSDGPHFSLDGQRFRFLGANAEYLPIAPDEVVIDVLKRAQDMGIRVIRTWGFGDGCEDYHQEACESWSRYFQPAPGVYNASAFEHFDRIVYEAGKRDIRLIIALANNWGEYGGIPRYVCWQKGMGADCPGNFMLDQEHDTFYTDDEIKEWYRQYVAHFVTHENTLTGRRYADDPTIMAWELINEPRAKSDPSGATLHNWIVEMSGYLAELAPDQLIGTGEEGWYIMPQTQAADFETWQDFPKNYWHYGVNWVVNDPSCKEVWGSNGADFISDNSTAPRTVTWHEETYVDTANKIVASQAISEERAAVPKVDFTGIHLYPAPDGTNLARAPYCEYYGLGSLCSSPSDPSPAHQARAWIKQHVEASHNDLNKPFLLEEFNFSDLEKRMSGEDPKYEKVTVTKDERALLFSQYLDFAYDLDVDGVLFWNLGYELGSDVFNHQSWSELDALQDWKPEDIVTKSEQGIQLNYGTDPAATQTTMTLSNPQVHWFRVDEGKVSVEVDNVGDAQTVWIEVQWAKGLSPQPLQLSLIPGKNTLDLTKLFNTPEDEPGNQDAAASSCNEPKQPPPAVTMVKVTVQDYTSPGTATFSFKTIFNNKYVIYPEDPVEEVIRLAAPQWQQGSAVAQASVKIDRSLICNGDTRIHPELLNGGLPIRFDFVGSIEHPDGYYYRYLVKSPGDQGQSNFGNLGGNSSGQILIEAPVPGKYQVSIAPEGVNFEDPEADSCHFQVTNSAPTLHVDALRVDGEVAESPDDTVRTDFALFRISRDIDISLSGTDDVSPSLAIKCRLLKDGKEVQDNLLSCHSSLAAATQKGAIGQSISIRGVLPPGQYRLELTAGDEESAEASEALEIEVFNPWYIYLGGLVLLLLVGYLVWWARVRPKSPKRA